MAEMQPDYDMRVLRGLRAGEETKSSAWALWLPLGLGLGLLLAWQIAAAR